MADVTKSEDGVDFPAAAYAYVPDSSKPSTWKIRLWETPAKKETPRQVGMAAAALSSGGFRGRRAQIPSGDVGAVKAKIRAAWKKVNPDKDPDEMPEAIKASEEDGTVDVWIFDEAFEPVELADPTGTDLYVPAPIGSIAYTRRLTQLIQQHMTDHGLMSADDHERLKRVARGHAGGKAKAAAAKQGAEVTLQDPFGLDANDHDEDDGWYKLAKNDPAVNYRDSAVDPDATGDTGDSDPDNDGDVDYCGNCRFYHYGTCALVEGAIDADDLCDLHRDTLVVAVPPQGQTYAEVASLRPERGVGQDGTRFLLPRTFAGASEWVHFLPKPGKYAHTGYGEIELTKERIRRIHENFKQNTYGQDLPINAEHDQRASGAVGWIRDMRIAADGGLEVKPEWNERGRALIDGDRFRFQSAEYFESWQDPVSAAWHDDVACGMAICTRPHFKTDVLRPLAATDGNGLPPAVPGKGDTRMSDAKDTRQHDGGAETKTPAPKTVELTEDQLHLFEEQRRQLTELTAKFEAEKAERERLSKDNRRRRFAELVRGRSGATEGLPWVGAWDDNIAKLEMLAEKLGEDDDFFKGYVADRAAEARRFKESGLFQAIGSNQGGGGDGTPASRLAEAVAAKRAANPGMTAAKAQSLVLAEQPDLYDAMIGGR